MPRLRSLAILVAAASFSTACSKQDQGGAPPPPEVGVVQARAQPVPITRDLVGRLSATRAADVRARVAGVLQKRLYKEGSDVKEGQVLFQIDPAPLRAQLQAAQAALAQAEANAANARTAAQRARELVASGLVSRSEADTAFASERSTAAQVQQAQAQVEVARISLGYATVRSPIAGRAGQQRVTEGALVGQNDATLLTTVEQVDSLYVNFDQPAAEVQRLLRAQGAGTVTLAQSNQTQVQLVLPDGTPYGSPGTLESTDVSVDPATGALAYRGVVPNAGRQLLPGMFVNVRVMFGQLNQAILVPQVALLRDSKGPYVQIVNAESKVEQKRVVAETMQAGNWVVTGGLAGGDRIIVSGMQRAPIGATVKAVEQQPQPDRAADAGAPTDR